MNFTLSKKDKNSNARSGILKTDHGEIKTPIFMPVGTAGTVKSVSQKDLEDQINAQIILGNTYHLYLRPSIETLERIGGLHKFISWDRPILTDSGGYQVYSLSGRRKITEQGVKFKSHIDGSSHFFTPENVMEIQKSIGADIIMAFDECTPYPCDYSYAKDSMEMTHRWLKRCVDGFNSTPFKYDYSQVLFPIIQGSTYSDLRKQSAEVIASFDMPGNAIGGLSVGEPHDLMYKHTEEVCAILPVDKPRYLMGVGTPSNLLECIALGIDMFDCVMPSRNARNGMLFTSEGIINIKNKKWENDFNPIDPNGFSSVDKRYSRSYLRHLFVSKEMLGPQIASIHNLSFYLWLVNESRIKIEDGTFRDWKNKMVVKLVERL
jgi:queuine tRNA-ribosyltransferase